MLVVFGATLCLSATLLFAIQPMFAKMVLPLLGGSPQVWNTCMVFYQAALLAGYGYAHLAISLLGPRRQALLHLPLLGLPLLFLPIGLAPGWDPTRSESPTAWLLGLLGTSVGVPFLVTAANAPMLQRWFSATGHPMAGDPYFLYGASNLGSLGALLAFPLLLEPTWTLREQSELWSAGSVILALLVGSCAILFYRSPIEDPAGEGKGGPSPGRPGFVERAWWIVLSLVPSSLLLGVTTHLTTNIAPVPLLWVVPLVLYLLTFIIVFARRRSPSLDFLASLMPVCVIPVLMIFHIPGPTWMMYLHLAGFMGMTLVCHRRLALMRPPATHLTQYYLFMSLGGVLGGLFNALVAPVIFTEVSEYPLMLVLGCMLIQPVGPRREGRRFVPGDLGVPLACVLASAAAVLGARRCFEGEALGRSIVLVLGAGAWFTYQARRRPLRFGLMAGAVLLVGYHAPRHGEPSVFEARSFFGVHRVFLADGTFHLLYHGNTLHGAQRRTGVGSSVPLTYYHPTGPAGDVLGSDRAEPPGLQVGLIGLGTGALASFGRPGQTYTFFEIDPLVIRIASDPRCFTYLSSSAAGLRLVAGDARLTLAREAPESFDVIVADAFSSDSIPVHLITREAIQLYRERLRPGGIVLFHVSNRYLDLEPVLAAIGDDLGLATRIRHDTVIGPELQESRKSPSRWVALAPDEESLDLWNARGDAWRPLRGRGLRPWTDDFSNVLSVLEKGR